MLFTASLGSVSSNTLISVTFDSIIYALYSLLGLSLAHILTHLFILAKQVSLS